MLPFATEGLFLASIQERNDLGGSATLRAWPAVLLLFFLFLLEALLLDRRNDRLHSNRRPAHGEVGALQLVFIQYPGKYL